jgi:hypothetical protein
MMLNRRSEEKGDFLIGEGSSGLIVNYKPYI